MSSHSIICFLGDEPIAFSFLVLSFVEFFLIERLWLSFHVYIKYVFFYRVNELDIIAG